jgi:vacuolar protein sorting-associated protein 54
LEVIKLKNYKDGLTVLSDLIKAVIDIKKTQPTIQVLLNQGDYIGALDLIAETKILLRGAQENDFNEYKNINRKHNVSVGLSSVRGLINLNTQLSEMLKMIGQLMESEFCDLLFGEFKLFLEMAKDENHPSYKWALSLLEGTGDFISYNLNYEHIKNHSSSLIFGLIRTDKIYTALNSYRESILPLVKTLTNELMPPVEIEKPAERPLPIPNDKNPPSTANSTAVAAANALQKKVKSLSFDKFMKIVTSMYIVLLQVQNQVAQINEMIVLIIKDAESKNVSLGEVRPDMLSPSIKNDNVYSASNDDLLGGLTESSLPKSMSNESVPKVYQQFVNQSMEILHAVSDLCHERLGKFLSLRAEQNSQLNFKDFFKLFDMSWRFIKFSESFCQRSCIGLRGTMLTQSRSFLNYFHMERSKQLVQLIDIEQWIHLEVIPIDYQTMVNKITKSNGRAIILDDFEDLASNIIKDGSEDAPLINPKSPSVDELKKSPSQEMLSLLVIDGYQYAIVSCVLPLIKIVEDYLTILSNVSSFGTEVLNKITEILKLFNSRVCSLIVGGAVVETQVLKKINAKHLALAGNSVTFVFSLIPHIKRRISELLPENQRVLVNELDKVLLDLKSNRDQIYGRIVLVMEDRAVAHCHIISETDWDKTMEPRKNSISSLNVVEGEANSNANVSDYMKNLVKETVGLHKVIKKYMLRDHLKTLFSLIFTGMTKRIETELNKVEIFSAVGKNRILSDIQYFISVLSVLDHVDGPGNSLEVMANNIRIKDIREKSRPLPVPPPAPTSNSNDAKKLFKDFSTFSSNVGSSLGKFVSKGQPNK